MADTALSYITLALQELVLLAAGEAPKEPDADLMLDKLNQLFDNWNAERAAVYNVSFPQYPITPNLQPHTIGPAGATFTASQRPVDIAGANIILNNVTPNVKSPLSIRDDAWWRDQRVPGVLGALPTDLYYSPDWPKGSIYLWPVPTVAYGLELELRLVLANVALDTAITLPHGYKAAVVLTLAESCATAFGKTIPPQLALDARAARARIFANNDPTPYINSADAGMPSGGGRSGTFNYRTREIG